MNTGIASGAGAVPGRVPTPGARSGASQLTLDFATPASNGSPITKYAASCSSTTTTVTVTATSHPIVVQGLVDNLFYACSVRAYNQNGAGPASYIAPGMPGVNYTKTTRTYCSPGGVPLLMDFFRPPGSAVVPVVLFAHGGGWTTGSRNIDGTLMATLLTSRGFALASVDYRLAPAVKPPDMLRDLACAVRYLRANAVTLGIKPAKIGGMGTSAGGHLISWLGVKPPAVLASDQYPEQSDKLQAVVDEFGIIEFGPDQMAIMPTLPQIFGTTSQAVINSYAPINYVTSDDPPFMIAHGMLDQTVPFHEAQDFDAALLRVHVPVTFVPIAHTGHKFAPVDGNPDPTMKSVFTTQISFFNAYLR